MDFIGFCFKWVLPNCDQARESTIMLDLVWIINEVFYPVLLGFTEFYKVLLGIIGFD